MYQDRRFNRLVIPRPESVWSKNAVRHFYYPDRGSPHLGSAESAGLIKCKLAYGIGYSVIIPDLIFLGVDGGRWIQPLAFYPNIIAKMDSVVECRLHVDISCEQTIQIRFRNSDLVNKLSDCSELYRCTITGPDDLQAHATGKSEIRSGNVPYVTLYHHTRDEAKRSILSGAEFWPSQWNIQGTKKLKNVSYVYFTPLDAIVCDDDLYHIAMANKGTIYLLVDHFPAPKSLSTELEEEFEGFILPLRVYRESTLNRTATLAFCIDSTTLASQHLLRHESSNRAVFYEVSNAFIHRVALQVGDKLGFASDTISPRIERRKRFDYVVVGDALRVSGLAAPYDEENTPHIAKLECVPVGSNLLDFWVEHPNQDHYSNKPTEQFKF